MCHNIKFSLQKTHLKCYLQIIDRLIPTSMCWTKKRRYDKKDCESILLANLQRHELHKWDVLKVINSQIMYPTWRISSIFMMTSSNGNIFRITGPLCGNSAITGEFPSQRPVTRSFDVFFDLRLNKRLTKQPRGWWFETPSRSLWRHFNV